MKKDNPYKLNPAVFWPMVILMVAIIALSFINQEWFSATMGAVLNAEVINLKWAVGPITLFAILGLLVLLIHPIGNTRLGGPDAKPKYKTFSYWGMLVCSAIAIGIVFWGVAYPMTYYMDPYLGWGVEPGTPEAAVRAIAQTNVEWAGQCAFYILFGIAMGVAIFNYGQPERTSSFLYLLRGKPANNTVNVIVDILCVFGIVAGVSCSLGTGTMQISAGLGTIFGLSIGKMTWFFVELTVVAGFLLMSVSGIAKGIKIVTDQNLRIYYIVMALMVIIGPTVYIFDMFFESTGHMINNMIKDVTYTGGINGDDMPIFWMIWLYVSAVAFAPIVGLFQAKISYGRTIKEMVIGGLIVPALVNMAWFTIFGATAIHWQESGKMDVWGVMQEVGIEGAMWEFMGNLPAGTVWCILFFVVIYISFVTLASSSTTSAALCSCVATRPTTDEDEPPMWIKCVWGAIMGVSAFIFISFAGIDGAKSIALIGGMPTLFLMLLAGVAIFRIPKLGPMKLAKVAEDGSIVADEAPAQAEEAAPEA